MTASFIVPLLLLAPAIYCYNRLVIALGFANPPFVLPLASIFAMRAFFEFAPGRIDYHNLQILLLLATLVLTLSQKRAAAFINGILAALALAISVEFAPFYALVMAIYACDFVFLRQDGPRRLSAFGLALAIGACALFVVIVPPSAYAVPRCDTYSTPHVLALLCAGLSFTVAPMLAGERGTWAVRGIILLAFAAASLAVLLLLFPQCAAGPYATLRRLCSHQHARQYPTGDEPVSASRFCFVGKFSQHGADVCRRACASCPLPQSERRKAAPCHPRFVLGARAGSGDRLFPLLSLSADLFGHRPGLRPGEVLAARCQTGRLVEVGCAGGIAAIRADHSRSRFVGWRWRCTICRYERPRRSLPPPSWPTVAISATLEQQAWPAGAVVLAPPVIGAHFLALAEGPKVVAVPNHP